MSYPINVLVVEDSEDDALLIINEMKEGGYDPKFKRVETKEAFLAALKKGDWDIIISDYSLPKFSGLDAVKLLKESGIDLPFILVSGTIGEELAVESVLAGAHDFIVKGKWGRFIPAINRELKEAKVRQEQKLGEEKLKESEERYRSLTETATYAIISADCNGTIISWNKGAQTLFGYTTEEVLGKPLTILMPEKYRSAHTKAIKLVRETGILKTRGKTIEVVGVKKDGNEFPLELSLGYWTKGKEVFYSGIIRDITKRKQDEEKLRKLSQAVEQSPAAVIITDNEGNIEYVNNKFCEITEYSSEEVIGKNPRILKSGEKPAEEYKKLWDTIKSGKEWRGEFHNKKKNGELFWEQARISPIKNQNGEITHFLSVKEDITEKKKSDEKLKENENQIRQSQKMEAIGTLAGGIAHDFNNMLTGIIGYTELTMESLSPEGDLYGNLQKALRSSFSARDIVAQLLTFSRKTKEEKEILQLGDLISDTLKLIGSSLPSNVTIEKLIDKNIPQIMGSEVQMQQILMNLCINAGHAMPDGGTLKITLKGHCFDNFNVLANQEISGFYAVLSVEDSGIGMDKDVITRIFEPFFTTKEVGKGTGLGLSTVFGIVKQHEGYITVDSKKGIGTIFHVYLPVVKKDNETILKTAGRGKPSEKKGESILFEDKEKLQNRFEVITSQEEFVINIIGNNPLSKSNEKQLLDYYVLARNDRKKIIINCEGDVEKHLKNIGFNKFLEVKPKPE